MDWRRWADFLVIYHPGLSYPNGAPLELDGCFCNFFSNHVPDDVAKLLADAVFVQMARKEQ